MVERFFRPDPAVCDSVLQGAESDPGTGGLEPSADRPVRMCGMDRGRMVCDGRLYAVTHDVPHGLDRVSSCPVLQPPSRWVRDGSGDGGEACVPGGAGIGWSGRRPGQVVQACAVAWAVAWVVSNAVPGALRRPGGQASSTKTLSKTRSRWRGLQFSTRPSPFPVPRLYRSRSSGEAVSASREVKMVAVSVSVSVSVGGSVSCSFSATVRSGFNGSRSRVIRATGRRPG